jgi:hypothetical protein
MFGKVGKQFSRLGFLDEDHIFGEGGPGGAFNVLLFSGDEAPFALLLSGDESGYLLLSGDAQ